MPLRTKLQVAVARLEEQISATGKALSLQADKYDRQLDLLKSEVDRLARMQEMYVPKGEYQIEYKTATERIRVLEAKSSEGSGRSSIYLLLISMAAAVLVVAISHFLGIR